MNPTKEELQSRFTKKHSDDLILIAFVSPDDYKPEAVSIAKEILEKRGVTKESDEIDVVKEDYIEKELENLDERKGTYSIWGSYEDGKYRPGWFWSLIWVSIFGILFSTGNGILVIPGAILSYINYKILERANAKKAKRLQAEEEKLNKEKQEYLHNNKNK